MYSTADDLYLWNRALLTEKLLPKKYLDMVFAPSVDIDGSQSYGFGWFVIDDLYLGKGVWHGGAIAVFSSSIYRYTDKDITVIILTNIDKGFDTTANGNIPFLSSQVMRVLEEK